MVTHLYVRKITINCSPILNASFGIIIVVSTDRVVVSTRQGVSAGKKMDIGASHLKKNAIPFFFSTVT